MKKAQLRLSPIPNFKYVWSTYDFMKFSLFVPCEEDCEETKNLKQYSVLSNDIKMWDVPIVSDKCDEKGFAIISEPKDDEYIVVNDILHMVYRYDDRYKGYKMNSYLPFWEDKRILYCFLAKGCEPIYKDSSTNSIVTLSFDQIGKLLKYSFYKVSDLRKSVIESVIKWASVEFTYEYCSLAKTHPLIRKNRDIEVKCGPVITRFDYDKNNIQVRFNKDFLSNRMENLFGDPCDDLDSRDFDLCFDHYVRNVRDPFVARIYEANYNWAVNSSPCNGFVFSDLAAMSDLNSYEDLRDFRERFFRTLRKEYLKENVFKYGNSSKYSMLSSLLEVAKILELDSVQETESDFILIPKFPVPPGVFP